MESHATRIFVYGTLKQGGENHRHLRLQRFVGPASTAPRYRLYELDGYPGMVESAENGVAVSGEVYEVDEDCLRRLDLLEGLHIGLYRRVPVALAEGAGGDGRPVQTYLYSKSTAGCRDLGQEYALPASGQAEEAAAEARAERADAEDRAHARNEAEATPLAGDEPGLPEESAEPK